MPTLYLYCLEYHYQRPSCLQVIRNNEYDHFAAFLMKYAIDQPLATCTCTVY